MNAATTYETGEALVALARQHGYAISQTQLARWHRAGLLPRPRQLPRRVTRGTYSCYPNGTGEQLLELCSLRATERRLSHLAWRLWLVGYPVARSIIRAQLALATQRMGRWLAWFKQATQTPDTDGELLDLLEHYAQANVPFSPLRRLRKRIGREHLPTFFRMLIELATESGEDRPHPLAPSPFIVNGEGEPRYCLEYCTRGDAYERLIDLRILARGLGVEKRFVEKDDALEYFLVQFLIPQLRWVFVRLQAVDWEYLLEHATDFDLLQTRDEMRTWLMRWGIARQYQDHLPADYPRWQIDVQQIFAALSTSDQALMFASGWRYVPPSHPVGKIAFLADPLYPLGPSVRETRSVLYSE